MTKLQKKRFDNAIKLLKINNYCGKDVRNYSTKLSAVDQTVFKKMLAEAKNDKM